MRVQVYRNLNKKCLSVVALEGEGKGRVACHVDDITLTKCSFVVRPAGRAKVLRTRRKNVHAFVRGEVFAFGAQVKGVRLSYNPYKHSTFVRSDTLAPVTEAECVTIISDGTMIARRPK